MLLPVTDFGFTFLGKTVVPLSNLISLLQSVTSWAPILSEGQAQRYHSPAIVRHWPSVWWIPAVLFGIFLWIDFLYCEDFLIDPRELMQPERLRPVAFKIAISRSGRDSLKYSSHSFNIVSYLSKPGLCNSSCISLMMEEVTYSSEMSPGHTDAALPSLTGNSNVIVILSICIFTSCSRPISCAIHQTLWASKTCFGLLA